MAKLLSQFFILKTNRLIYFQKFLGVCFVQILEKEHDKLDSRAVRCVCFRIYSDTKKDVVVENPPTRVCDLTDVTFFENAPYFSTYMNSTTKFLTTHVTFLVPLEDLLPLQVYQRRKNITTDLDSLFSHQSAASTEVSELPIALRKGTLSCIQHPIDKVLSFSHLSPTYFRFVNKLSLCVFLKTYRNAMLDSGRKSALDEEITALHANKTCELTSLPLEN